MYLFNLKYGKWNNNKKVKRHVQTNFFYRFNRFFRAYFRFFLFLLFT